MSNSFNMPPVPPNPYGSPLGGGMPGMPGSGEMEAREKVKLPAIFLIICGVLGLLAALGYTFNMAVAVANADEAVRKEIANDPGIPPDQIEVAVAAAKGVIYAMLGASIANLMGQVVILLGGISLMRLSGRGTAMTGSIVAVIPCLCASCGIFSMPFGIWALIAMNDASVKANFK